MLQMNTYLKSTKPFNFTALNSNLNLTNETINDIVNTLMYYYSVYRYPTNDFFGLIIDQFQILSTFCRLSQETVQNALIQLSSIDFTNIELLSFDLLNESIQKMMTDFKKTMPKLFINTLSLIRETIGSNMFLNYLFTNWILTLQPDIIYDIEAFRSVSQQYNGCNCGLSSKCVVSSRGMLAGCYILETILQTTIQCLYNQTCIDRTNTFQSFFTEFNNCAPSSCTYIYTVKYNIKEGITTLIDLYGGLFIIYRILSILIVKYIIR
ncbi:hypothetical protein I4U23_016183 [Adineta vaga]|nr:hypothetical protein I4U23_016183 [Adineta vaga]